MKEIFRYYIDLDMMPMSDALGLIQWKSHIIPQDRGADRCFMDVCYNKTAEK